MANVTAVWGSGMMHLRDRMTSPEARELWARRVDALKEGTLLVSAKPNREEWTDEDYRIWRYASAISRRIGRLH
jgi:hypothetical protein